MPRLQRINTIYPIDGMVANVYVGHNSITNDLIFRPELRSRHVEISIPTFVFARGVSRGVGR